MLVQKLYGGIPVLTDEALFGACGVRIAFTGRAGGTSVGEYAELNVGGQVGDDPDAVAENRRRVLSALGADDALLVMPDQVHGVEAVFVREGYDPACVLAKATAGADIVVVEAADVAPLINSADCLSLIAVSPTGRFAVAHAGWRGAVAGVAGTAVRALARLDAERAGDVPDVAAYNVYLGPHIRSECFEVGADVAARFADAFGESSVTVQGHVDLARAVSCDLVRAGIDGRRIADARICTKCSSDQYFSYRATSGRCGRHAAVAVRVHGSRRVSSTC